MSYASRSGRARTSMRKPRAFGVCFRCGIWYNRDALHFQYDWRGVALQNLYILVCDRCMDVPNEQLRAIQLPADPVPVYFPSVEQFEADENDFRNTLPIPIDRNTGLPIPAATPLRVTQDCENRITQPLGCPDGLVQPAVNSGVPEGFSKTPPGIGVALEILSVTSNGTATIQVTCSAPHNLQTEGQISAEGLLAANGFYSVKVLGATSFTYRTARNVAAANLLTPTTRIITALVGLPYGSKWIPKADCSTKAFSGNAPQQAQFVLVPTGQATNVPSDQGILTP